MLPGHGKRDTTTLHLHGRLGFFYSDVIDMARVMTPGLMSESYS